MKRRLFNLLIAHVAGSYVMYLLEDIRRYVSHIPIEPIYSIGAPVFAPIALCVITLWDQYPQVHPAGMIFRMWMAYLGPAAVVYFVLVLFTTKKRAKGECPVCGYDLRATPERCPECGTVPKASTPS